MNDRSNLKNKERTVWSEEWRTIWSGTIWSEERRSAVEGRTIWSEERRSAVEGRTIWSEEVIWRGYLIWRGRTKIYCRRTKKKNEERRTIWHWGRRSETRVLKTQFPQIKTYKLDFYLRIRVLNAQDASFQHCFETGQLTKIFNI